MACCKRLVGVNHLYIYPQTQPRWTTLQIFCRKCTKNDNPKWPPHTFYLYNFWTGCPNLMCDTSFLIFFAIYISIWGNIFHWFSPYLSCLCEGQGEIKLLKMHSETQLWQDYIFKYNYIRITLNVGVKEMSWFYWTTIYISKGTCTKWV